MVDTRENSHHLDLKTDSGADNQHFFNGADRGKMFAEYLLRIKQERGIRKKLNNAFLGLGCGGGIAEIAMAKKLKMKNITLVDREPFVENANRKIQVIQQGLFSFLETPVNGPFDIVSALSIEYLLEQEVVLKELLTLLNSLMVSSGILFIYPAVFDFNLDFEDYGFVDISDDSDGLIRLLMKK